MTKSYSLGLYEPFFSLVGNGFCIKMARAFGLVSVDTDVVIVIVEDDVEFMVVAVVAATVSVIDGNKSCDKEDEEARIDICLKQ